MRVRGSIILLICGASALGLALVLLGRAGFHNPNLDDGQVYSLLGTVIQTTGTFGAVALAVVFLTAQLSGAGRPSVVRELYRSRDVYILFGYAAVTVLGGYAGMLTTGSLGAPWRDRVLDSVIVLACASVLLVLPALMSQIENLDQTRLAAKLAARIRPKDIVHYGLADVRPGPNKSVKYELVTVGLRPRWVDPLRPLHELIMEAVSARDRVLFGKLFRYLVSPVAKVHGLKWDYRGDKTQQAKAAGWITRLRSKRHTLTEKTHVTLSILHYSVKRARNLLTEWEGRDIGRHGVLTGIGDLVRCLATAPDSAIAIRICLAAVFHIERFYCDIEPYGRIEPMNGFFETARLLMDSGKRTEAESCARILGWASVHTQQFAPERSAGMTSLLGEELERVYEQAANSAMSDPTWTPVMVDDPWRNWPPAEDEIVTRHNLIVKSTQAETRAGRRSAN
jgi:hypothetical protein